MVYHSMSSYLCSLIEFLKFINYNIVQSKDNTFSHTKLKLIYEAFAIVSMYRIQYLKNNIIAVLNFFLI